MMNLKKFIKDCTGNLTIVTALTISTLGIASGSAVDYYRIVSVKGKLQNTADAAVLVATDSLRQGNSRPDAKKDGEDYFLTNIPAKPDYIDFSPVITFDPSISTIKAKIVVSGNVPTTLMNLAGISEVPLEVSASTDVTVPRDEITLVLDVSQSMKGRRLKALKKAAKEFIDTLKPFETATSHRVISIVPFANRVNWGLGYSNWVDPSVRGISFNGCFETLPGFEDTANKVPISISTGLSFAVDVGQSEVIANTAGKIAKGHPTKIMDYIREVPPRWREAGKEWLSCSEWQPEAENVVPTNGAMAGGVAAISTVSAPGDKIVMEGLTYCSIARSATLLGRRIIVADFDGFGIIPEAFERICAQQHPKILFIMPAVQNPTLANLSRERRIAIADIAHRYNVWIIEDSIYAPLVEDKIPPIAHFAPDRTFHTGGLSKCVSAGIRSGWIACPPRFADRIANAHKMLTGGAAYWLTELASTMVLNGDANKILELVKAENQKRHSMAAGILKGNKFKSHPYCPYIWIKLPDPWHSGTFKNALAKHNIIVSGEDDFKPARTDQVFHGTRIGLSSVSSPEALEEPLKIIRSLLESGIAGYDIRD